MEFSRSVFTRRRSALCLFMILDQIPSGDRGWTVIQIPSTPGSFLTVGVRTCGPDWADRGLGRLCQLVRQLLAAARELDDAVAKAGGPGPAHLWSVVPHARGIVGRVRKELRRRILGEQPWRLVRSGRWGRRPLARPSPSPS